MATDANPKNWREAAPYVVWGILAFSFGMEGCVTLVHFEWLSSFFSFSGMVAVISLYFARDRLIEKLDSLHGAWFIVVPLACLVALAVVPAFFETHRFAPGGQGFTPDQIAEAVIKKLPIVDHPQEAPVLAPGQTTIGNLTIPMVDRILEQPTIEWDGKGPIIFHARVDHAIEKLPIYLDWGLIGPNANFVLNNGMMGNPRVEIGFIERLAAGQVLSVTIGEVTPAENGQQQTLQWGAAHYGNPKTGISAASYMARVVIIRKDGKEEQYPFLIVPRTLSTSPTIISTGVLEGMIIR